MFQRGDLIENEFQPAQQPFDLGEGVRWDWVTQTGTKVGQTPPAVFQERVVILDAERREDSTDPVGKADAFGHELCSFADRAPCILIGFVRDRYHRADARFAAKPRQQRTQE